MKFYVMRHGETDSNKRKLIQGQTNESLNYNGILQTKKMVKKLKEYKISLIISSDLNRAKETSKIISKELGLQIKYFKLLREKDNGSFTGKPSESINWGKIKGLYQERKAPNGENLYEVLIRAMKFLNILKGRYEKEMVLIVSHGTMLKLIKGYLEDKDIKSSIKGIKIKNAEVCKLKCQRNILKKE